MTGKTLLQQLLKGRAPSDATPLTVMPPAAAQSGFLSRLFGRTQPQLPYDLSRLQMIRLVNAGGFRAHHDHRLGPPIPALSRVQADKQGPAEYTGRELDELVELHEFCLQQLSPWAKYLLAEFGTQFGVTGRLQDFDLAYKFTKGRGMEGVLADAWGLYNYRACETLVPVWVERDNDRPIGEWHTRGAQEYAAAIYHEIGHALDHILEVTGTFYRLRQGISRTPQYRIDFAQARARDAANLAAEDREALSSYLTKDEGGSQITAAAAESEVWAQLFAESQGHDYYFDFAYMTFTHPETAVVFNNLIQSLEQGVQPVSDYSTPRLFAASAFYAAKALIENIDARLAAQAKATPELFVPPMM